MLKRLIIVACLTLLASHPAAARDQVTLQLKWKHQFQFAGYYAALDQGFYRDAGLDVTIREGGPDIDAAEAVAAGKAEFGVCSSNVLREWVMGRHLVVLAVIFQQSPAIILVPRRADIRSVADLRGRLHRVGDVPAGWLGHPCSSQADATGALSARLERSRTTSSQEAGQRRRHRASISKLLIGQWGSSPDASVGVSGPPERSEISE
jgi:NMT1/THI5 like